MLFKRVLVEMLQKDLPRNLFTAGMTNVPSSIQTFQRTMVGAESALCPYNDHLSNEMI